MIASLRGTLTHKSPEELTVEVGGVGYEVRFSPTGLALLPEVGEPVFLHIFTNVREDSIDLFGFRERQEKEMFIVLISVSGVGPKLAMNILSGLPPAGLASAILTGDLARLTKLPGVGRKTAERLCVELKDKVQFIPSLDSAALAPARPVEVDQVGADVVSALVNLGYAPAAARQALERVRGGMSAEAYEQAPLAELLRLALRSLA
ncbi:MAG TPA: Holliday junction branch migration protein RuvA [Desulfurivibrionaceae bacterium]|nr:Holliday junction branch migration protein RuvA [Desulfurivibrionaceae bacterium]